MDLVNQPPHYTQGEEFRGYCKGNALKYIWREKHKGGRESLAKGAWYLARLLGTLEP